MYELVVRPGSGRTAYELFMPYSELGGISGDVGVKIGLSLQLSDNDGAGRVACMNWGDGLRPAWAPARFGVVTFVE